MANKLKAPKNGVTIRMYRQGHGDCYLLAFPREDKKNKTPYYVLIDCGYKNGSQKNPKTKEVVLPNADFKNIADSIFETTNGRIDLFVITHEHQDHVNGIKKKFFDRFHIEEAWFAWTEDPDDEVAQNLVKKRKKAVNQLLGARMKLALAIGEENDSVEKLDNFIGLELGHEDEGFNMHSALAAAGGKKVSVNRQSMDLVRGKAQANKGVTYWKPGSIAKIKETEAIQAYVLGPPTSKASLKDLDPVGDENFESHHNNHFAFGSALTTEEVASPFDAKFGFHSANIFKKETIKKNAALGFYSQHYGNQETTLVDGAPSTDNADWRRIDESWLHSADNLAIKLNSATNNTSLVLAFELPKTKKILLFVGDAQRGNWISWTDNSWKDADGQPITVKNILNRTVLYKVGHHGSHNATMNGNEDSPHANLSWMGKGKYGNEFTAMINAVKDWAWNLNSHPWIHPLPSIKNALLEKTQGRVFQTDTSELKKPDGVSDDIWQKFIKKSTFNDLYFDYTVLDEFE